MFPFPFSFVAPTASGLADIDNVYSMEFDGINDYIDTTPILPAFGSGSVSASVWIKTSVASWYNTEYPLVIRNPLGSGYTIGATYGQGTNRVITIGSSYGSTKLNDGNWHHLVWTRDIATGDMKAYVDGVVEVTKLGWSTATFDSMFRIGASTNAAGAASDYFEGIIDEVALFNYALDSDQITEIYDATSTGKTADLSSMATPPVAWYRMGD